MEDFGPSERERLLTRFGKEFSAGQVIFREGDLDKEAYLLSEGRVRLTKRVRSVERNLMVLRPGDLFGESAFITGTPRSSTAVALSAAKALALDHDTFRHLLEHNSSVAGRIVQQMVRRLRDAEDQLEIMMLRDTQSKIVMALLKLAHQGAHDDRGGVTITVSPMELATRVGLEVEAVKRGVQKLRDGEYVRVAEERLEIPDLDALHRLFTMLGLKDDVQGADHVVSPSGRPGRGSIAP